MQQYYCKMPLAERRCSNANLDIHIKTEGKRLPLRLLRGCLNCIQSPKLHITSKHLLIVVFFLFYYPVQLPPSLKRNKKQPSEEADRM